ncbi:MAG: hypothetical protein Q8K52_05575 [Thiobacillus sp.]|nr:hypothetical protein [Thiobacillus sp.]
MAEIDPWLTFTLSPVGRQVAKYSSRSKQLLNDKSSARTVIAVADTGWILNSSDTGIESGNFCQIVDLHSKGCITISGAKQAKKATQIG